MSPLRYRFHRLKKALFDDSDIIYEVLIYHKSHLPSRDVPVTWERSGAFIVGKIIVDGEAVIAQGRSATEFVECVNDALYASFKIPANYAEALGGDYRLTPPPHEFNNLNDKAIQRSKLVLDLVPAAA